MNYLLDIVAVVIFLWAIFTGYKKGFVKTVLGLCSGIICLLLAISFSAPAGNFINRTCISPVFETIISEKMQSIAPSDNPEVPDVDVLVEQEPNDFLQLLKKYNIDLESFKDNFELLKKESSEEAANLAVKYVAQPISETISYVIAFILIILVSSLALSIVSFILNKIVKLPLLRTANKFLGIVCGVFFGSLWVYAVAVVVEFTLPYIHNSPSDIINQINPENTLIFKYLYFNNPVSELIKSLF